MNLFNKLALHFAFFIVLLTPAAGLASGDPTAQLSSTINEFVGILVRTPVSELRSKGLPQRALELIYGRFDFSEMARQSLGSHWQALSPAQQREFIGAYTQMLLRLFGRSVRSSGDETIQYKREVRDGDRASVETEVVSGRGQTLAIDYWLHDVNGQWKVYDVVIDNISIVNNYRAQFERVITKTSVQDLLQKMKQLDS